MKETFEEFCGVCQTKCCNLNTMITSHDDLKNSTDLSEYESFDAGIYVHWGTCSFLTAKGCNLTEDKKPFDCKLFPLTFMFQDGKINIYLNKKCNFAEQIDSNWINYRKDWLKKQLQNWTKEEIISYSDIISKYSSNNLFLLESLNFK
ncbi:MAG: hypothetical protein AB7V77_05105 [Candidatus Woesearchaeota archaeon]